MLLSNRDARVLVVEDDQLLLRIWSKILGERATLEIAPSFEAAWRRTEAAAWKEEPCDFVLLDLGLPDGNGADLLPRLERLDPRPPVAVISGRLDAVQCLAVRGRCAIALTKPVDGTILRAVLDILEEERSRGSIASEFAAQHRLSGQERKLLDAALRDLTNEQAAELLGCAHSTVRTYWGRIFQKVGCRSEREVVVRLFRFASARAWPANAARAVAGQGAHSAYATCELDVIRCPQGVDKITT